MKSNKNAIDTKNKTSLENKTIIKGVRILIKSYRAQTISFSKLITVLAESLGELTDIENELSLFIEIAEINMTEVARVEKSKPQEECIKDIEDGLTKILSALDAIEAGETMTLSTEEQCGIKALA